MAIADSEVVAAIRRHDAGRDPERLALRYARLRADPFRFLRGTAYLFYATLASSGDLPGSPFTWLCGDAHLENFGSYQGDNGLVYFDLNDFDEAILGPCLIDVVRMLTSLHLVARRLALGDADVVELCSALLDRYCAELGEGKVRWVERATAQGPVRALLRGVKHRKRRKFLDGRTVLEGGARRLIMDGGKALPLAVTVRARVAACVARYGERRGQASALRVLDVGRRIAGTGSLGVERYVVLVEGEGSPDHNWLIDLKAAEPPSALGAFPLPQPPWASDAERIVEVQRHLQAIPPALLGAVPCGGRLFVLRELQPSADRIDFDQWDGSLGDLVSVLQTQGQVLAWTHLRGAGWRGGCDEAALVEFGRSGQWIGDTLALARHCAAETERQWQAFAAAYDAGALAG